LIQFFRILTAGLCLAGLSTPVLAAPAIGSFGAARFADGAVVRATNAPLKIGSLLIETPFLREPPPGARVVGGFLRITNTGSEPDRLVGIEAAFADHVDIHETSMQDNIMRMRQLTEGLEIKPGQTVELKPGSYHMMFVGVKEPLKQGSRVSAILDFAKAGKVVVEFDVVGIGAGAPQGTSAN
jgi:copper(I)-binding protein